MDQRRIDKFMKFITFVSVYYSTRRGIGNTETLIRGIDPSNYIQDTPYKITVIIGNPGAGNDIIRRIHSKNFVNIVSCYDDLAVEKLYGLRGPLVWDHTAIHWLLNETFLVIKDLGDQIHGYSRSLALEKQISHRKIGKPENLPDLDMKTSPSTADW